MPFHFCPQCGTKLQPVFRFCPSCGNKLPCPDDECVPVKLTASLGPSFPERDRVSEANTNLSLNPSYEAMERKSQTSVSNIPVTVRPALQKTWNSLRLDKEVHFSLKDSTLPTVPSGSPEKKDTIQDNVGPVGSPAKQLTVMSKLDTAMEPSSSSPVKKSPRPVRGKAKLSRPAVKQAVEGTMLSEADYGQANESAGDKSPVVPSSSISSPNSKSPLKSRSKAKKAKHMPAVEPLQEGEEVTDTTCRKWKLVKLLSQSTTELVYEVVQMVSQCSSKESTHILKLGAKDGRIFTEQNFLQRAAKPAFVEKWMKQNKLDFLGIPSCVGFGLHADSYRFLVFPNMGQSLQSVMEEEEKLLSETAVLHLACRILDVLQYIHSNEYVHADINADNVYIKHGEKSQVFLVGFCHAFRFCPGGRHVEYREASKTPHEGTVEFISLDAHKGAAPSRRGDLHSVGYCMLRWHTGTLPWTGLTQPDHVAMQKRRYMEDVPALLSHCFGKKKVPGVFQTYLSAVMTLQYSEQPDYSALKTELSAALLQRGGSLEQLLSF